MKAKQVILSAMGRQYIRSVRELSDKTGIPPSTLNRKLNMPRTFTCFELSVITDVLRLSKEELFDIVLNR